MSRCASKSFWFYALIIAAIFFAVTVPTESAPATEGEVKAVLLFHMTQFVTPPDDAKESEEFTIGILGPDPFRGALEAVVKGEKVGERQLRILQSNNPLDLVNCSIVYVSPQVRQPVAQIMTELKKHPILTVGESEEFLKEGGIVQFKKSAERKVRLQVHLLRAREKGFKISAQLLRVSDVIGDAR